MRRTGITESGKEVYTAACCIGEGLQYPAEAVAEALKELVLYGVSGASEVGKIPRVAFSAISEAWQAPKEPLTIIPTEIASYLRSGRHELTSLKKFTADAAEETFKPIEEKLAYLVELGRRIRAEKKKVNTAAPAAVSRPVQQ